MSEKINGILKKSIAFQKLPESNNKTVICIQKALALLQKKCNFLLSNFN